MSEPIKSDLQKKLEAQGWNHLTNECPDNEVIYVPKGNPRVTMGPKGIMYEFDESSMYAQVQRRGRPLTDEELKREFLNRKFKEVLIADAYDIEGKPLPKMRAVYIKQ